MTTGNSNVIPETQCHLVCDFMLRSILKYQIPNTGTDLVEISS